MNDEKIIALAIEFVKFKLKDDNTGHDWWHTNRVWKMSLLLSKEENANLLIVQLTSLFHDVEDWKFNKNSTELNVAKDWMEENFIDQNVSCEVLKNINDISYKGENVNKKLTTIEAKIVQDADRLDAIGAIGIARAFATGATKCRNIFEPEIPIEKEDIDFTKKDSKSSIHHFYDKLLLLKDQFHTKTANTIAKHRHDFMEKFLLEFLKEWNEEC